ncbi:MAG: lysine--tRNA ligase [Candidatus Micrarchaeota archaeon]|nr:lysine--tRNA ligase [Candidatus Micrarchaeota archaeon]
MIVNLVDMKVSHWVEDIAEEMLSKKKEPYVINSGMTTSGNPHLGTVCEFLYPSVIYSYLKAQNKKVNFYFEIDIMDAFDSIPENLKHFKTILEPHLGKPLCFVPDPFDTSNSYGEHFLNEALEIIKELDIEMPQIFKAQDLYAKGYYDKYVFIYFNNLDKVKEIVENSSMRKLPDDWSPIMPICDRCGKIATTRVTTFSSEDGYYEYVCDKDIKYTKGCNNSSSGYIKEHNYKITWRLDWPARQHFLNVSIEGAGVDHMTKGGSWDTAKLIHEKIFNSDPPVAYRYGFIMLEGKKYSKSKGKGFTVKELLEIIPPQILKYALLKPDIQENIEFKDTNYFFLTLIEDYIKSLELLDAVEKKELAYENLKRNQQKNVAAVKISGKFYYKYSLQELFIYKSLYKDWKIIEQITNPIEEKLKFYVDSWSQKNLIPEEYFFEYKPSSNPHLLVKEFFANISESADALEIHNKVFEFSKSKNIQPNEMFKLLYNDLIGKDKGPKLGKLVFAIGIKKIKKDLNVE